MTRFRDIDIYAFGNDILLAGAIYSTGERNYALFFPESQPEVSLPIEGMPMDPDDWQALLKQTDQLNVQLVDGTNQKAIFSKGARTVDTAVSWKVWKRDGYACRYCGADDCPLSVDHLVLWEEGGPWTMDNLVSACKRDNKKRGRMQYAEWLQSDYYKAISRRLTPEVRAANEALLPTLASIPRLKHPRGR